MLDGKSKPRPESSSWTLAIRKYAQRTLPLKHLLPDRQPVFVGSWVYIFGVISIAGLVWVIGSGVVLAFFGPNGGISRASDAS